MSDNVIYVYANLTTGLKNKNYMDCKLPEVIQGNRTSNYTAILIDLNGFKTLNDGWGYDFGNKVLKEVGKILLYATNNKDIVIYLGSDRFVIIAFEEESIDNYAEKILNSLRITMIIKDTEVYLTGSMGIYTNTKGEDIFTTIQNADIALNCAKKQGNDCFNIFESSMKEDILRKLKVQTKLKKAIKRDLLEVYYQPKINLEDGNVVGIEALLRWTDEEFGNITPNEFISIAEETGVIMELGRYVLRKVCMQIKTWEVSKVNYINVAVNISSKQFRDISLPEYIANILEEYELPTSVLELEVTESAIIDNVKYANSMIDEFIKKGIKIALDDFGTGYSSYDHLNQFGISTIKIDKSFIDCINWDNKKNLIIKNMIDLAHILDMKVVAEGVEWEYQMKILKEYGCDIIQGYYYSKPLCVHDFEKYILEQESVQNEVYCKFWCK